MAERRTKETEERLQWHPAFYAGLQITLAEESDHLIFENEHQLGTKPKAIDVLIIKKEGLRPVRKAIGRIFRRHNIIEYKGPTDYLSIDDFYKGYGYACFYKADGKRKNDILMEELTLTFACHGYPRELFRHLKEDRNFRVQVEAEGIYSIIGDYLPIQILLLNQLAEEENLRLRHLTNQLDSSEIAGKLVEEYQKHKDQNLYQSVMDMIIRANKKEFEEAMGMCEALEELFEEKIAEKVEEKIAEKFADELEKKYLAGEKKGLLEGERINNLNVKLINLGRTDDVLKAASDKEYQKKLFEEFGL